MIVPENMTFNDSENVTLTCIMKGGPDNTFQWNFNGEELDSETSSDLTLLNVTAENGGAYTCNVTNVAGSDTYTTYVFISPMITMNPVNVTTTMGTDEVSFNCSATAFPEPSFVWRKEGDTVTEYSNTSTLTIGPVMFGDEGQYYCVAMSNDLMVESEQATLFGKPHTSTHTLTHTHPHVHTHTHSLNSQLIPHFSLSSTVAPLVVMDPVFPAVAYVGQDFNMTCSVEGGPDNSFQWDKDSDILVNETTDTLSITDVAVSDAGLYTCTVTNAAGNDSDATQLYVAPNIITAPQNISTDIGASVHFLCVAEGAPVPCISWEYDGNDLSLSGSGSGGSMTSSIGETVNEATVSSTLTINPVEYDSFGVYRCVANSSTLMRYVFAEAVLHGEVSHPSLNTPQSSLSLYVCVCLSLTHKHTHTHTHCLSQCLPLIVWSLNQLK